MKLHSLLVASSLLAFQTSAFSEDLPPFLQSVIAPVPPTTPAAVAAQNAINLDNSMQDIYANALAVYQQNFLNTSPIILALFTNTGGNFILYRPGKDPLTAPQVPIAYQVVKGVSHSAMAVYQIIAPFILEPSNPSWRAPMRIWRESQKVTLDSADALDLPADIKANVKELLSRNIAFMDECLKSGTFTLQGIEDYATGLAPFIQKSVEFAARLQVGHWMGVMAEWKKLLGNDWEKTYGVTNTLYVTRTNNIFFTIMAQFFGKEAINSRLILLETTEFTTEPTTMLNLLSRIVADRALGKVFFKNYYLMDVELVSTGSRDAIASTEANQLKIPASAGAYTVFSGRKAIETEAKKLGFTPLMPPLAPFHSQEWPWRTSQKDGKGPDSLEEALDSKGKTGN